jgi:3-oxoacyl-[acyl-carrier protein] reductase
VNAYEASSADPREQGDTVETLAGQTALVTGAGRGLGRVYANRLAELGANVAVVDIDLQSYRHVESEAPPSAGSTVVDEIRAKGVKATAIEADAADEPSMTRAAEEFAQELGPITILVANAGAWVGVSSDAGSRASEISLDRYRRVMGFNFFSTVCSVNAVVPYMKEKRYGKIVTVASEAGLQASVSGVFADYGVAKAAIVMYTKYLAQDLGPYGITANCISPGYIGTAQVLESLGEDFQAKNALGRIGKPDECASVIEFLTTGLSSYVTGAVIDTSGGWVRGPNI